MLGGDNSVNTAAHIEITDYRHFSRLTGLHEIVEDPVNNVFMERTLISE